MVKLLEDSVVRNHWHAVSLATEIKEGILYPINLFGEDIVVWRMGGNVLAWQDLCIHRGVRLSIGEIRDGCVRCPYHGWTYNSEGQCVHIPAHPDLKPPKKARVMTYQCREYAGLIWINVGDKTEPLQELPEYNDSAFRVIASGPYIIEASVTRVIENFLDVAHLPIVHENYLGIPDRAVMEDYKVEDTGEGLVAKKIPVYQPNPDGKGKGAIVQYDYGISTPFTVWLRKWQDERCLTIVFPVHPIHETKSKAYFVTCMNYDYETPEKEITKFHETILMQDKPIVESQRPELLPVDLSQELHLRSDKLAIAYRQYVKQKGLTFGIA